MHVDAFGILTVLAPFLHDIVVVAKSVAMFFMPSLAAPMAKKSEWLISYGRFHMHVKRSATPIVRMPRSKPRRRR